MTVVELTSVEAVIEVQEGGAGSGARAIVDLSTGIKPALGGFTRGYGAITRGYRLSPRTNRPVPRPVRRDQPEDVTVEMTARMAAFNYMEQFDADSRLALYVRHPAQHPGDPLDYSRVDILNDVALEGIQFGDLVADEPNTDDITITVPLNAAVHVRVDAVEGKKVTTGWASADDCDVTAGTVDDDGVIYLVTKADAVGLKPYLCHSDDDGATWTEVELTDLSADCSAIVVAGNYLIISATTTIAVYSKAGVLQNSYTAAQAIAALAALDAANLVAVGASGLVIASEDGGITWETLTSGSAVALGCLAVRNGNEWFIGGATGTLLKYHNGTISAIALPGALAAVTVNSVALPECSAGFTRSEDIYIGMGNGTVYKSVDDGDNWEAVSFPGSGAGSVTAVAFSEFLGQVFWLLHTAAGGDSTLSRDFSGGAGGTNNVEALTSPANSGHNALVPIDANNVWVVGDIHSAADLVVKVERS